MAQSLDVCKRESGKIWHRKPAPSSDDGLVVSIKHTLGTAVSPHVRTVRFLHTAFDSTGNSFIAGDHQGNIYMFDVAKNRFSLVHRIGQACTALAFGLRRKTEFLAALADYTLRCYDTDSRELIAQMKGHDAGVHTISLHASGRYAISSSSDTAQLWDLDTFQRRRKLNIKQSVGIVKVFFVPLSNTILTCFKDDSIFGWESDTLQCRFQLPVPEGKSPQYKAFACPRDGRLLAAGGKSNFLHLWALDSRQLLRIVQMPPKVRVVRQLEFLPDNFDGGSSQTLGVLSQDGIMRFINIHSCKLLFDVGSHDNRITNALIGADGRHVVCTMEDGSINVYSVQALTSELNKPPPPLLKVVSSDKEREKSIVSRVSDVPSIARPKSAAGGKGVRPYSRTATRVPRRVRGQQPPDRTDTAVETDLSDGLHRGRLLSILKGFGEYPAKYRMFIWRSLLKLPENHAAYSALLDKGVHSSYVRLHEQYPIKSQKLLRVLQRTLSALAHWSPIFGETDYLALLAFPFVKLFQNNQMVCFEAIATILVNWCQQWFEYFPNPPINVLNLVENLLAYHDKHLLQHLITYNITAQTYAWPLLETLFSEVLTKDEWLKLFDNVFSNHPSFLILCVAAYAISARGPLTKCTDVSDFEYFFHHRNAIDIGAVIREAYRLQDTTPEDIHPRRVMEEFQPLTRGQYPIFNKYPTFIVDYQVKERERIREEELQYLQERQVTEELKRETERKRHQEEAWYRQQELLEEAEETRRRVIADEEQKLTDQRVRLAAMRRELRVKELQLLDAARRRFMEHQHRQKETELKRLDDEIERKVRLREQETHAAIDDVEVKNMELHAQRGLFEQELARDEVAASFLRRADMDAHKRQQDLEDRIQQRIGVLEREREQIIRREVERGLARAEQQNVDTQMDLRVEQRQQLDDLDREIRMLQLAKMNAANRQVEEEVHQLMKELENKQLQEDAAGRASLQNQRKIALEAEQRRMGLLREEQGEEQQLTEQLRQDESFERLRDLRDKGRPDGGKTTENKCLNNSGSGSEASSQFSLDRGRQTFERREQELMKEVRDMRKKLAEKTRQTQPPPSFNVDDNDDDDLSGGSL
ncbi:TBC1 domain family member 31-like [Branchiostoma floridae]|uniref:TBC1 domain family member 31 n=1 Tax=Branchiostoma floridae TaxID=7739 RepID=A0A9J7MTT7_BRAFL|nr:TBC1 domain family member 31-like [Branchiostoma floridae]